MSAVIRPLLGKREKGAHPQLQGQMLMTNLRITYGLKWPTRPEISTCATKGGTNTSRETFSIATKLALRTVRTVRSSRNAVPANQHRGRGLLRTEETAAMIAFRQKMATPEAQKQYRRRSRVIEFCHAWIKSKLGLRQVASAAG